MTTYCRAQAQINKFEKEYENDKKTLNERIRTFRSLLLDELSQRNISCIELDQSNSEPVYIRLKTTAGGEGDVDTQKILDILKKIDRSMLDEIAEKHAYDLPKMICNILSTVHRVNSRENRESKLSLSVTTNKERGFTRQEQECLPAEVLKTAAELVSSQHQLKNLRKKCSESKQPALQEQKEVEEVVKESLKTSNPHSKTTKVHMSHEGSDCVYYLRCKEKSVTPNIGIRKVNRLVEETVVKVLNDEGFGREYTSTFRPNNQFWNKVEIALKLKVNDLKSQKKVKSRLTLDKGAPRGNANLIV